MEGEAAMIRALDHVQLAMPKGQEDVARRFYGTILGMREVTKPETLACRGGCWFQADGAIVHLGVQEDFVPAKKAHPAFTVADVDELAERLRQAGCALVPDHTLPQRRRFYTFDPFGNRIEFIQDGCGFSQDPRPPLLYSDLAHWWPLFSPPEHYADEAADLLPTLLSAPAHRPQMLLELGAGGGSLAFHLKRAFQLTLTDISPAMLAVSRQVNPECEHAVGDMRTLDLGRQFDLVLIHDAIMYMTDPPSVQAALATAYRHCAPGGAVVIVPDVVKETFTPKTVTGGEDGPDGRGLRYLEWVWDPDPGDDTYEVFFAFVLREADGSLRVEHDRHRFGLFARNAWLEWLQEAGFEPTVRTDPWGRDVFTGTKAR